MQDQKGREVSKASVIYSKVTIERIKRQVEEMQWERYRGNVSQYIVDATLDKLKRDEGGG